MKGQDSINRYSGAYFKACEAFPEVCDFCELDNINVNDVVEIYSSLPLEFQTEENKQFINTHIAEKLYIVDGKFSHFFLLETMKKFDIEACVDDHERALQIAYTLAKSSDFHFLIYDWGRTRGDLDARKELVKKLVYNILPMLNPAFECEPLYCIADDINPNFSALTLKVEFPDMEGEHIVVAFNQEKVARHNNLFEVIATFAHERLHADQIFRRDEKGDEFDKLVSETKIIQSRNIFDLAYLGSLAEIYAYDLQCTTKCLLDDYCGAPRELESFIKNNDELAYILNGQQKVR